MRVKISAKTVAKLGPGQAISDIEIRGFSARRWDTGAVTYSLRYRTRDGDRKRINVGVHGNITPDEARRIAKQRAGEIAGGADPAAEIKQAAAVANVYWRRYGYWHRPYRYYGYRPYWRHYGYYRPHRYYGYRPYWRRWYGYRPHRYYGYWRRPYWRGYGYRRYWRRW